MRIFLEEMNIDEDILLYDMVDILLNNVDQDDFVIRKEYKIKATFKSA